MAETAAAADAVAVLVDCAVTIRSAIGQGAARRSAVVGAGIELAFGVACAARSGSGADQRALGEACQASGVPLATRVGRAAVLGRVGDGALHDAGSSGRDFADGGSFASGGGGDFAASGAAGGVLGVPEALRIGGATNASGVTELAGSCASRAGATVLAESRSNAGAVAGVGRAGRSA